MLRAFGILVAVALVALTAWRWRADHAAHRTAVEPAGMAAAWQCLFAKDVDVSQLQNGQQVRRLLEAAHDGQREAYPERLKDACLPRLAQARRALGEPRGPQATAYAASLGAIEDAVRLYAERLEHLEPIEELDEEIVSHAHSWYSDDEAHARHAGYERFLTCAVPTLQTLADDRALYDWLADRCFKQDPVPFMARVRKECGSLLEQTKPSPTLAASRRKFHDLQASPQVQSWESCADIAREQERMAAARELVAAGDAYLAARPGAGR